MSRKEEIEKQTEELLSPILEKNGVKLWDVEYVKEASEQFLRVYIDKPEGVSIDDCVNVSRELSDLLDEKDFIPEAYTLEVSSPGLGRSLKRERDFINSIGRPVDIKLYKGIDGVKEYNGVLKEFDKDSVTVLNDDGEMKFERKAIAGIKLSFEL